MRSTRPSLTGGLRWRGVCFQTLSNGGQHVSCGQLKKEDLWRSRLRRFQSSGMSVTRFCEAEGVSAPSFYQWRKRLGTGERRPKLRRRLYPCV